jgi:hypothetical protein
MNDNVYLAVDNANGAIMYYSLNLPTNPHSNLEYVEATQAELMFLNSLEDHVLPAGTVVTLKDLEDHRKRVKTAKARTIKADANPAQQPSKASSMPSDTHPSTSKESGKASLIAALRKRRSN